MPFINKKLHTEGKRRIRPDGDFINYKRNNKRQNKCEDVGKMLISAEKIGLSYDRFEVISNLSFSLSSGDYLCIIGENGSGKSTLIDAILGLKKVEYGSIEYIGLEGSDIGFLPQKTEVQSDFPATVWEIVLSGCINKNKLFFNKKDKERAFDSMEKLGITYLAKCSFRELSGGQQQRVLIARAISAAKKLIILDEPVTGLDVKTTQDMYTLIDSLNKEEGMAVIMITHDMSAAKKYASKILYLGNKKYSFGDASEIIESLPEVFDTDRKNEEHLYGYRYGGENNGAFN